MVTSWKQHGSVSSKTCGLQMLLMFILHAELVRSGPLRLKNCTCGQDYEVRGRVIGGTETLRFEFPWQAAMFYRKKLQCGGSLINDRYVLSAAHCFKTVLFPTSEVQVFEKEDITFVLGGHDLGDIDEIKESKLNFIIKNLANVVLHPLYDPTTFFCDISLSRFDSPIENFAFNIQPVCLPPPNHSFINAAATVSGWGALTTEGGKSDVLMKTKVRILPNQVCSRKLKDHFLKDVMMCAAKPGHDACHGDSGGPLVSKFGTHYFYQLGIVSYGIGCGNYDYPGVYTRLNTFLKWIIEQTEDAIYCKREQI